MDDGSEGRPRVRCQDCAGKGRVRRWPDILDENAEMIRCPMCFGAGTFLATDADLKLWEAESRRHEARREAEQALNAEEGRATVSGLEQWLSAEAEAKRKAATGQQETETRSGDANPTPPSTTARGRGATPTPPSTRPAGRGSTDFRSTTWHSSPPPRRARPTPPGIRQGGGSRPGCGLFVVLAFIAVVAVGGVAGYLSVPGPTAAERPRPTAVPAPLAASLQKTATGPLDSPGNATPHPLNASTVMHHPTVPTTEPHQKSTATRPPTLVATPPPAPTATPPPTPTATPEPPSPIPRMRHLQEKQHMLDLINEEREQAGLQTVGLGLNDAAQLHAEASLANCSSSHWGVDGLKPYMRYSLAGGYQANSENVIGLAYCIKYSDGFQEISIIPAIGISIDSWMRSPGHRRNILNRWHRKVNIGLAWDHFNIVAVQHFEGDYVEYDRLPSIENGAFSLSGEVLNGAKFDQDDTIDVMVYYDPPPYPLTRGQLSRTYCYDNGVQVAYLRRPLSGAFYLEHSFTDLVDRCTDPYDIPPETVAPSSEIGASLIYRLAKSLNEAGSSKELVMVSAVTASEWQVTGNRFSIKADLSDVLSAHGPGVYTVILWGHLGGAPEVVSEYSIFHTPE